jgi:hypothetical protein
VSTAAAGHERFINPSWAIILKQTAGGLVLISVLIGLVALVHYSVDIGAGTFCRITKPTDAVVELNIFDSLERAEKISDVYGTAELRSQGKVLRLPAATHVLVIQIGWRWDDNYLYRRVRVLDGDLTGRAFWVSKDALEKARPRLQDLGVPPPPNGK